MADRPSFFTYLDRTLSNIDPNFATDNLNLVGVQPLQIIKSKVQNTLTLVAGLWQTYLDYRTIRSDDYLATAVDQRWSSTRLEYPNGVSVTTGPGVVPTLGGVYYFGGLRIQVDESFLTANDANPLNRPFVPLPGRVWIYLDVGSIADPTQPFATLRIEDVAAGTPEAPLAGELALVGLDISLIGETFGNVYPVSEPAEEIAFGTRTQRYTGPTTFTDTITANKAGAIVLDVDGQISVDGDTISALVAVNDAAGVPAVKANNASGTGLDAVGTHATAGAVMAKNAGAGPSVHAVKTDPGNAIKADATVGGDTAVEALGGTIGVDASGTTIGVAANSVAGSGVDASTTTGVALTATSAGSGNCITSTGGPNAASKAGSFLSGHTLAITVQATTIAAAKATAVAVAGTANGDAVGVRGLGADGYGVVAQSDASSPKRSAFRLVPQDADPTTALQGDMQFNDSRGANGKLRVHTAIPESVHGSIKGWVRAWSTPAAAGGPIGGGSGDIAAVTLSELEESGDVLLTASGHLEWSGDATFTTVVVRDVTAAVNIATWIERAMDSDGGGNRNRTFSAQIPYTPPSTASRTYAITLNQGGIGTFDYALVILKAEGTQ